MRVPVEGDHDEVEGLAHPVDDRHDRLRLVLIGERATDEVILHVDDDERALARHACWG